MVRLEEIENGKYLIYVTTQSVVGEQEEKVVQESSFDGAIWIGQCLVAKDDLAKLIDHFERWLEAGSVKL